MVVQVRYKKYKGNIGCLFRSRYFKFDCEKVSIYVDWTFTK